MAIVSGAGERRNFSLDKLKRAKRSGSPEEFCEFTDAQEARDIGQFRRLGFS